MYKSAIFNDPCLMGIVDQVEAVSGLLDQNCDDDLDHSAVANSGHHSFWKYLKAFEYPATSNTAKLVVHAA